MKKGTKVRWETVGRGHRCVRTGEIVAVVPPLANPEEYVTGTHLPFGKRRREGKSYLVKADNGVIYWPDKLALEEIA